MNRDELEQLATRWRRQRFAITVLWATAAALGTASGFIWWRTELAFMAGLGAGVIVGWALGRGRARIDAAAVAAHLDHTYATLQASAGLWLRVESDLTPIEQLQRRRIDRAWHVLREAEPRAGAPSPRAWRRPVAALMVAVLLVVPLTRLGRESRPAATVTAALPAPRSVPAEKLAVRTLQLTVTPPDYLAQAPFRVEAGEAEVPEGSQLVWEIATSGAPAAVRLEGVSPSGPLPAEEVGGGHFRAVATIHDNCLYRVVLAAADGALVRASTLHVIRVRRDLPPRIEWREPVQPRTVLEPGAGQRVAVSLAAVDDHATGEGVLIVTVAKGSGEGVKFREVRRPLRRTAGGDGHAAVYTDELMLDGFQLEPGDEVYFHALISDRRTPTPNTARSETRFVVLRGADTAANEPIGTLAGVNRLPPFFRSQRQVILDTERLVAERSGLDESTRLARSQEIGVDQKLLRLRYGQFLGEEFEPASLGAPKEAEAMAFAGRLRTGAGAASPQEAAVARAIEAGHDHPAATGAEVRPATVESLAAAFVHRHDNPEAATLFDPTVQASLRSVLAAMWEAEGLLRSGRPAEALPAEHRALELLKALQQADRVYVRRTGFEPAPLKEEERRLRGELEGIPRLAQAGAPLAAGPGDAVESAVRAAVQRLTQGLPVAAEARGEIEAQLTEAARREPARNLKALEIWRRSDGHPSANDAAAVVTALLASLPEGREGPALERGTDAPLVRRYFDRLQQMEVTR